MSEVTVGRGDAQPRADGPGVAETSVRLSVVIVNWNTVDLLRACLLSMDADYLGRADCEVIVVDNHSADGSPDMVEREFAGRVTLMRMSENLGFSGGNNVALRVARGEYVVLLNSDTEVCGDALWQMCDYLDANDRVGALGARLLNPDGSVQMSCRSFPSYRTALFHRKSIITRLFPGNRFSREYLMSGSDHEQTMEVDWVIGACLMTRRTVIDEVGLLDDGFFMYAEDVDWCYRMRRAGWTVEYFPDAVVMHHYEKSSGKAPFRMNFERHRSMWRFYYKHYSRGIVLVDLATLMGIAARCVLNGVKDSLRMLGRGERRANS